jgi:putative transposase
VSQYYAAFQGHSEKELELVTETLRQQARLTQQAASITPLRLADFLAKAQAHERVLVQRLRDQEAQGVLACIAAGVESKPLDTPTPVQAPVFSAEPVDLSTLPVYQGYR